MKPQTSNIKTSNMQDSSHAQTPGCNIRKKADTQMQDRGNAAGTLAAGHPKGPSDKTGNLVHYRPTVLSIFGE